MADRMSRDQVGCKNDASDRKVRMIAMPLLRALLGTCLTLLVGVTSTSAVAQASDPVTIPGVAAAQALAAPVSEAKPPEEASPESGIASNPATNTKKKTPQPEGLWGKATTKLRGVLDAPLFVVAGTKMTLSGMLWGLGILVAAWFASNWIQRGLERYGKHRPEVSRPALYALGRILHYLLIAIGIGVALSAIGLDLTKIAFFASALGVGIGFGLKSIVNNFISGLILLFERTLKIGDFVELESGVTGEVTDISIRTTRVTTNDNIDILVPNSEFVDGRVTSWTLRETTRRIKVKFGVAYGTDKNLVKKAALEAAAAVPFTFASEGPRRSQVWLVNFGDNSLDFQLVVWLTADAVKRPGAVQAAYYWALEDALVKYGIEIPFPQRDLHVRSLFSATEEDAKKLWSGQKKSKSGNKSAQAMSDSERETLSGNDALDYALSELPEKEPGPKND